MLLLTTIIPFRSAILSACASSMFLSSYKIKMLYSGAASGWCFLQGIFEYFSDDGNISSKKERKHYDQISSDICSILNRLLPLTELSSLKEGIRKVARDSLLLLMVKEC